MGNNQELWVDISRRSLGTQLNQLQDSRRLLALVISLKGWEVLPWLVKDSTSHKVECS